MHEYSVSHLHKRRANAAQQAEAARLGIAAVFARNGGMVPSSDWGTIARTAAEGAYWVGQVEAFDAAISAINLELE